MCVGGRGGRERARMNSGCFKLWISGVGVGGGGAGACSPRKICKV